MGGRGARGTRRPSVGVLLAGGDAVILGGLAVALGHPRTAGPAVLVGLVIGRASGLYRARLRPSGWSDLPALVLVAVVAGLVAGLLPADSRTVNLIELGGLAVLASGALRGIVLPLLSVARRRGRVRRRVVVVGTGRTARLLTERLGSRPELGLTPVGFVTAGSGPPRPEEGRQLRRPLLGSLEDLPVVMAERHADTVLFALPRAAAPSEVAAARALRADGIAVLVAPRTAGLVDPSVVSWPVEAVGDLPLVRLRARPETGPARLGRRSVERVLAVAGLVVLAPVLAGLGALIRLETGRAAVVRRPAVDAEGRPATLAFLRTRRVAAAGDDGVRTAWRVGPVGRLIRCCRLEALPQRRAALVDRLRRVPRLTGAAVTLSSAAARGDQTRVDPGQLAS